MKAQNNSKKVIIAGIIAGILAVLLFRRNLGAELHMLSEFGVFPVDAAIAPDTSVGWLELFHSGTLRALVLTNFFDIVNGLLVFILMLNLYLLSSPGRSVLMLVSLNASLGSALFYLSGDISMGLYMLSSRYIQASDKTVILQKADEILAEIDPGNVCRSIGMTGGLLLLMISGLLASIWMYRSGVFGRKTAWTGMTAHGLGLVFFIVFPLSINWAALPMALSAPFIVAWYVVITLRLFREVRRD